MAEQSALVVWFYKSDTRRQAPFVLVHEPWHSRHDSAAAVLRED